MATLSYPFSLFAMKDLDKTDLDILLQLSSIRALWGQITPALRSVSSELQDRVVVWQCIFDKYATEVDFELMRSAAAEVLGDFGDSKLREQITIVPAPSEMEHLKNLIYLRHEANNYRQ